MYPTIIHHVKLHEKWLTRASLNVRITRPDFNNMTPLQTTPSAVWELYIHDTHVPNDIHNVILYPISMCIWSGMGTISSRQFFPVGGLINHSERDSESNRTACHLRFCVRLQHGWLGALKTAQTPQRYLISIDLLDVNAEPRNSDC